VQTLEKGDRARVYVFYTHHRPWLKDKDLEFFDVAIEEGFVVEDVLTELVNPMFENDRGDETERGTVHGRILKWP
jgi:EEF1A N-terminal glycine/lysine methyltransferase